MKGLIATAMLMTVAVAVAADAQTFAVEAGGSGLAVTDHAFGLEADAIVGGGYIGGSLELPVDVFSVYVTGDWWSTTGVAGRFGASARLVPADWLVRPSLRIGALFNAQDDGPTAGLGVYVGRRSGGLLTADVGRRQGANFAVVHVGAYYRFGE